MNRPWRAVAGGVEIFLRVTAKAGADRIAGQWRGPQGAERISIRVAAAPEKGRANEAAIRLLAGALAIAPSALRLTAGETDRLKTVRAEGDAADMEARLGALMRRLEEGPP